MGQMIQKPDTNPVIVAVLNLVLLGAGGYFMMGQQKKAMMSAGATLLLSCLGGIGMIVPWITADDAYLLGQKLQNGEAIGENENGLPFLNSIFKD